MLGLTLAAVAAAPGVASPKQDPTFNPAPEPDDLVLPMPGGLDMAFRRIDVPGDNFWYDPGREVRLGDVSAKDPFSRDQPVRVMGAFQDAGADHWWYPIGKYEVSIAQFAAIMGNGNIDAGLARLGELSGDPDVKKIPTLQEKDREARLAEPVRWISWHAVQEFIREYNLWLFEDAGRTETVPALKWKDAGGRDASLSGFVRLPSEIEWEYAARGGREVLRKGASEFEKPLPFELEQYTSYAWLSDNAKAKVRPIGTRKPIFGLHDTLGNVGELVVDAFLPELGRGKVGGLTVRGGSVKTAKDEISLALRAELPIYQEDLNQPGRILETRNPFTGFRLVVGSLVLPDTAYRTALEQSFQQYAQNFRSNAQVPTSGAASPLIQSNAPVQQLQAILNQFQSQNVQLRSQIDGMIQRLQQIEQYQDQAIRKVTFDLVENAISIAAEFGRNYYRWRDRENRLPKAGRAAKISTQGQAEYVELFRNTRDYERLAGGNFDTYVRSVRQIAEYGQRYAENAIKRADQQQRIPIDKEALLLIAQHVQGALQSQVNPDLWRQQLVDQLARREKVF